MPHSVIRLEKCLAIQQQQKHTNTTSVVCMWLHQNSILLKQIVWKHIEESIEIYILRAQAQFMIIIFFITEFQWD